MIGRIFPCRTGQVNPQRTGFRGGSTEIAAIGDDAISYEAWFKVQVQRALDDPRPGVDKEEVRQHFTHRRQALRQKLDNDA